MVGAFRPLDACIKTVLFLVEGKMLREDYEITIVSKVNPAYFIKHSLALTSCAVLIPLQVSVRFRTASRLVWKYIMACSTSPQSSFSFSKDSPSLLTVFALNEALYFLRDVDRLAHSEPKLVHQMLLLYYKNR